MTAAKITTAAKIVSTACKVVSNAATFTQAAIGGVNNAKAIVKNMINGKLFSEDTVKNLVSFGINAFTAATSGKNLLSSSKELKKVVGDSVGSKWGKKAKKEPLLEYNLQFFADKSGGDAVQTISNKFPNDNQAGKRYNYTRENGKLYIENGVQNSDFVIDMDGNLHLGRGHSYLADGNSVQAAGTMKVNSQGYIRLITNESGHFQPNIVQAMNYPTIFRNVGLNIDNAWIRIGEFKTSMSNYVIDSRVFYNGLIKNMP